jgi:type IV pilus assembly protein PilM
MATRVIGLDIGTLAVRAAELTLGRGAPSLQRFGQVALPPGAVMGGEIVDAATVSAAIRRLWREAGFAGRHVVLGVGNQRVVVRQADLPDLPDDELRSAIRFQAAELIPIPIDEAVFDVTVLSRSAAGGTEGSVDGGTESSARVLLAAAHREMVDTLVGAVRDAGLEPTMVDLVPFALIRSLAELESPIAPPTGDPTRPDGYRRPGEAIVGVGAGVTNVVVHEDGVPQFVRILTLGGNDLSRAVADELGLDPDVAEDLKRRASTANGAATNGGDEERAARVLSNRLAPFLDELRGSLDYYIAQEGTAGLRRVVLTGGGCQVPGLAERLSALLGVPVVRGRLIERMVIGNTGLSTEQLTAAEDLMAVPVGLALASQPGGPSRISLLPVEARASRASRRQVAIGAGAVAATALMLGTLWLSRSAEVDDVRARADASEDESRRLQAELSGFDDTGDLQVRIDERTALVQSALSTDVAWTRLLNDVASVIPDDVWLTSFQGSRTGEQQTVSVSGMGVDFRSAARWLQRIGDLPSVDGLWLPTTTRDIENQIVSFTSNFNLTDVARSRRVDTILDSGSGGGSGAPAGDGNGDTDGSGEPGDSDTGAEEVSTG